MSGYTKVDDSADATGNQDGTTNASFESDVICFGKYFLATTVRNCAIQNLNYLLFC